MEDIRTDQGAAEDASQAKPPKAAGEHAMPKWETDARARLRTGLHHFQKPLADLLQRDVNEADTRLFVTDFLCEVLSFDKYADLTSEYPVKGECVDYSLHLDKEIVAFVEIKRVNMNLSPKHLRQAQTYAVNEGVEWLILTNGSQWQLYHLSGGLPIITDLVLEADLLSDQPPHVKVESFFYLTKESVKRGKLDDLWQAQRATSPKSFARVLLSPTVLNAIRKELRRLTGFRVDNEEIARLLTEHCIRPECFVK